MAGILGTIAVNVVSRHSAFVKGMDQSRASLAKFSASVGIADRSMRALKTGIGLGIAALTTGRVVTSLRATAEELDKLGKSADKLGISSERLAGLHLGAELEGLDAASVDASIQQMTRRISILAATGKGEAAPAIKELGIELNKIKGLSPDKQLEMIADRLSLVTNQSDKVRLAFQLFGRAGTDMVTLLKDGSDGLKAFHDEAKRLGIAIDRESIKRVEEMNDALTRLGKSWNAFKSQIVIDIAPAAIAAIKALQEIQEGIRLGAQARSSGRSGLGGAVGGMVEGNVRAFTGQTWWQKAIENWLIRGDVRSGVAAGTPAPEGRSLANRMASLPGFDPETLGTGPDPLRPSDGNKSLFKSGHNVLDRMGQGIVSGLKALNTGVKHAEELASAGQRQLLASSVSGGSAKFRSEMDAIRKQRHEDMVDDLEKFKKEEDQKKKESDFGTYGINTLAERGVGGSAAARQSERINQVLNKQLAAQQGALQVLAEIEANTAEMTQDQFAGL